MEPKFDTKPKLFRKKVWESVAAQTLSGLIILAIATLLARATGFVSTMQALISVVTILGCGLIVLAGISAYKSFPAVRARIRSWMESRHVGKTWLLEVMSAAYITVSMSGIFALLLGFGAFTGSLKETLDKHPDKTSVVYSALLALPVQTQQARSAEPVCHRKVIMLSNQTGQAIVFTGGWGLCAGMGVGLAHAQDLNWIPVGTADATASTGAMTLGPYQAALVSFTSTDAEVAKIMTPVPASPLVEVRATKDLDVLTPSLMTSVRALDTVTCHAPTQVDAHNIPSGHELFEQLYPRGGETPWTSTVTPRK